MWINLLCSDEDVTSHNIGFANIGFDDLKPVILISVTDHALEYRENWSKNYWIKIPDAKRTRRIDRATVSRQLQWGRKNTEARKMDTTWILRK